MLEDILSQYGFDDETLIQRFTQGTQSEVYHIISKQGDAILRLLNSRKLIENYIQIFINDKHAVTPKIIQTSNGQHYVCITEDRFAIVQEFWLGDSPQKNNPEILRRIARTLQELEFVLSASEYTTTPDKFDLSA